MGFFWCLLVGLNKGGLGIFGVGYFWKIDLLVFFVDKSNKEFTDFCPQNALDYVLLR